MQGFQAYPTDPASRQPAPHPRPTPPALTSPPTVPAPAPRQPRQRSDCCAAPLPRPGRSARARHAPGSGRDELPPRPCPTEWRCPACVRRADGEWVVDALEMEETTRVLPGGKSGLAWRQWLPKVTQPTEPLRSRRPVASTKTRCVGAQWPRGRAIRTSGQISRCGCEFLAPQGAVLGRSGLLRIAIDSERIQVGGISAICIDGSLQTALLYWYSCALD